MKPIGISHDVFEWGDRYEPERISLSILSVPLDPNSAYFAKQRNSVRSLLTLYVMPC